MKNIRILKSLSHIWMLTLGICLLFYSSTSPVVMVVVSGEPNTALNPSFVAKFGSLGTGDGQFDFPQGNAVNSTHILVADTANHRIQIFDSAGNFVTKFGSLGSGDGQFSSPSAIAVNNTHIFVVDTSNFRIQIFDLAGNFVTKFGSFGSGDGLFDFPVGIALNSTHIFVVDYNNHRIQIFDSAGNFVTKFGSFGTGDGQFNLPRGIAVNNTQIFVVDTSNHRIQIFDSAGNFTTKLGSFGTGDSQFNLPYGIAVNNNYIFIADTANHRIQIFDSAGNFVTKFGSSGTGDGEFSVPSGIATNNTRIFVTELGNDRIQIFDVLGNFAPQQLLAQVGQDNIGLTWFAPMDNNTFPVSRYRVYRSQQTGLLNYLADTINSYYNDSNVTVGQTYYYAVTAVTSNGESKLSEEVSAAISQPNTTTETISETTTETISETTTETSLQNQSSSTMETVFDLTNSRIGSPTAFDGWIDSIDSTTIIVGTFTLLGLSTVAYYFRFSGRGAMLINKRIKKILDPLVKGSPALLLLLQSKSESVDSEFEKEFQEIIPKEIFHYKFLLHPIRLSIIKLLCDNGKHAIVELKEILEISSTEINNQLKALENKSYVEIEATFINESPKKIIHLSLLGLERYRALSNLLLEFASN